METSHEIPGRYVSDYTQLEPILWYFQSQPGPILARGILNLLNRSRPTKQIVNKGYISGAAPTSVSADAHFSTFQTRRRRPRFIPLIVLFNHMILALGGSATLVLAACSTPEQASLILFSEEDCLGDSESVTYQAPSACYDIQLHYDTCNAITSAGLECFLYDSPGCSSDTYVIIPDTSADFPAPFPRVESARCRPAGEDQ